MRKIYLWSFAVMTAIAVIAMAVIFGWPQHMTSRAHSHARKAIGGKLGGTVQIPLKVLTPVLAARLRQVTSATITGFRIESGAGTGKLCLNANADGFMAGRNGDQVELWRCDSADSEIWIPVQWDDSGRKFTLLANYEYQSKCLNADNIGNLHNGHRVQLWDCYNGSNESWDFGDWYDRPNPDVNPYPLFLEGGFFCLDADKYYLSRGDGDPVHIWQCYDPPNQLWS